jgi:hypothetical protein
MARPFSCTRGRIESATLRGSVNRRQVADTYRQNRDGRPTADVASQLCTSHRNATRWVALARKRGFLPPYGSDKEED